MCTHIRNFSFVKIPVQVIEEYLLLTGRINYAFKSVKSIQNTALNI